MQNGNNDNDDKTFICDKYKVILDINNDDVTEVCMVLLKSEDPTVN